MQIEIKLHQTRWKLRLIEDETEKYAIIKLTIYKKKKLKHKIVCAKQISRHYVRQNLSKIKTNIILD